MRILCLGAGGFIGGHLYRHLVKDLQPDDLLVGIDRKAEYTYSTHPANNWKHILVNCQLENEQWVNRLLLEYKPSVIYAFQGCPTVSSMPQKIWISNVQTVFNVLNNLSKDKVPKFILASSVLADDPQSVYGASKAAAENLVTAYGNLGLIDPIIFRLVATCGADNTHGAVRDIVKKFMTNEIVEVFGKDPGSYKPYTHVEDVVNIIQYIVNYNNTHSLLSDGWPITIAPHYNSIYIHQICEIVDQLCPVNKPWKFNGQTWPGDQEEIMVDSWILKRLLVERPDLLPYTSAVAVEKAVKDILKLDYGVIPTWESLDE